MEIRALNLRITQEELNGWIQRLLTDEGKVRGLSVDIATEGLHVRGEARLLGWIPFEADLEVGADGGFVGVHLAKLQAGGFIPVPAGMVMGELEKLQKDWLRIEGESFILDIEQLLQERGVSLTANLSGVTCAEGVISLEAQEPAAKIPPAP